MSAPLTPLRPYVPVMPGPDHATLAAMAGIVHDGPQAPCSACASTTESRSRRTVDGFLLMLCNDAGACFERFREDRS